MIPFCILIFWNHRSSKVIFNFIAPNLKLNSSLRNSLIPLIEECYLESKIQAKCAYCYWGVTVPGLTQQTEVGNVCLLTYVRVHTHTHTFFISVSIYLYFKICLYWNMDTTGFILVFPFCICNFFLWWGKPSSHYLQYIHFFDFFSSSYTIANPHSCEKQIC